MILVVFLAVPAGADPVVLDASPVEMGALRIMAYRTADGDFLDRISGEVISLPDLSLRHTSNGGKFVWRTDRDWVDDLGFRHVTYRQFYRPPQGAVSIPPYLLDTGVLVIGASLLFHYDADNELYFVHGTLFEDVETVGTLALADYEDARGMAWWALEHVSGREMADYGALHADAARDLKERSDLELVSTGDGISFEYVWKILVLPVHRNSIMTAIHGRTGELLGEWDRNPHSDCEADCRYGAYPDVCDRAATGFPQNTDITEPRTGNFIKASPIEQQPGIGGIKPGPFVPETETRDAHRQAVIQISTGRIISPDIQVFRGVDTPTCPTGSSTGLWEMIHLSTELKDNVETAMYGAENGSRPVLSAAGDAMYKTSQTMNALKSRFGWRSFDNSGSDAHVVVDARCVDPDSGDLKYDNATYVKDPRDFAPTSSIAMCWRDEEGIPKPYFESAALDVIAHEWGHAVIYESAGWGYQFSGHKKMHEGWADIIAHIVEWNEEPPASYAGEVERADWLYGEDNHRGDDSLRAANMDDGYYGMCYHREETGCGSVYGPGHIFPVVFWLVADGISPSGIPSLNHKNPLCIRNTEIEPFLPGYVDCSLTVPALDMIRASEIFFRVLTVYGSPTDDSSDNLWHYFVDYAITAAHDLYGHPIRFAGDICSDALEEQDSVFKAFAAVGIHGDPDHILHGYCGYPS